MAEHKYAVKVPALDRKAYNPQRPISDLVKNQVLHLSLAERHLPKKDRTGTDVYSIRTEEEAARYIHHLTAKLHPQGARKAKRRSVSKVKMGSPRPKPGRSR